MRESALPYHEPITDEEETDEETEQNMETELQRSEEYSSGSEEDETENEEEELAAPQPAPKENTTWLAAAFQTCGPHDHLNPILARAQSRRAPPKAYGKAVAGLFRKSNDLNIRMQLDHLPNAKSGKVWESWHFVPREAFERKSQVRQF